MGHAVSTAIGAVLRDGRRQARPHVPATASEAMLQLLLATHPRLGARSLLRQLPDEVLRAIASFVRGAGMVLVVGGYVDGELAQRVDGASRESCRDPAFCLCLFLSRRL